LDRIEGLLRQLSGKIIRLSNQKYLYKQPIPVKDNLSLRMPVDPDFQLLLLFLTAADSLQSFTHKIV
jgi:hypothetical protein